MEHSSKEQKKNQSFLKQRKRTILAVAVFLTVGFIAGRPLFWPGGYGVGPGTTQLEASGKDSDGYESDFDLTLYQSGKTLWDWLSLLGVPLSLLTLSLFFQQAQSRRNEKIDRIQRQRDEAIADLQRQRDEAITGEEVLQTYFDRISALLVDKNLLALAEKAQRAKQSTAENRASFQPMTHEELELLGVGTNVIRARTLAILRRFAESQTRKTHVAKFLIESEVVSQLKLSLNSANLSGAKLHKAQLSGTDFSEANLRKITLSEATLSGANLNSADLSQANLSHANLVKATLTSARLGSANLSGSDLTEAELENAFLTGSNLQQATLASSTLARATLDAANLSRADLSHSDLSLASLKSANLHSAKLIGCKLAFAELNAADLSAADLTGADLRNAQLVSANLNNVSFDDHTRWPRDIAAAENLPTELKIALGLERASDPVSDRATKETAEENAEQ